VLLGVFVSHSSTEPLFVAKKAVNGSESLRAMTKIGAVIQKDDMMMMNSTIHLVKP
jgi:hypothetical protein